MVKEDEVLAFVRDESFEVRAHDAVPCRSVLHLEFRLRRAKSNEAKRRFRLHHTYIRYREFGLGLIVSLWFLVFMGIMLYVRDRC